MVSLGVGAVLVTTVLGAPWMSRASLPMAPVTAAEAAAGFLEGRNSSLRSVFTAPGHPGEEGSTRIYVNRRSGPGRVFDLTGSYWLAYGQKSARYVLLGVGPVENSVYITRIRYIDENSATLSDSKHGLAKDAWVARAAQVSDDGEYIAFVGRHGPEAVRLWVLKTANDTIKAIGPAPPPIPADPGAYDVPPKNWSDEAFDDVIELAPGLISFPDEDTLQVVYGHPLKNKGKGRSFVLSRIFGS